MKKKERKKLSREERIIDDGLYLESLVKEMYDKLKVGESIISIADYFDDKIKKDKYIAYPVSIEPENFACNFSPVVDYNIESDSTISFTFQIIGHKYDPEKKRFPLKCAYTKSINDKNYFHLLKTVRDACNAGMKSCGPRVPLTAPRKEIMKVMDSFSIKGEDGKSVIGIKSVMNLYGFNLEDYNKIIPTTKKIPTELKNKSRGVMKEGELYYIDVYGTNLSEHDVARDFKKFPTMLVIPVIDKRKEFQKRLTHLRRQRKTKIIKYYDLALKSFGTGNVFSLRHFRAIYKASTNKDLGVHELRDLHNLDLIRGYPAKFVEFDFDHKLKQIDELKKRQKDKEKEISNITSLSDKRKIEDEIDIIKEKVKKLRTNEAVVIHFGNTILITSDGIKFIC
jgi:methionine aminopeptidase